MSVQLILRQIFLAEGGGFIADIIFADNQIFVYHSGFDSTIINEALNPLNSQPILAGGLGNGK
ncbi:MAG: hypothetical protein CO094_00040 [Anaerolineae bacterium CG_4_9_14_3_um_filter_57_17]|nr:MAG: hypothetical protein AUK01_09915 [Anaerolineae bacterium CG2_30_57_67]PJB68807.1 MAG: hypothetical protein CO094_00040 [Anaerolineae bacterium CG_4_9_14_3_um_filter_57_17]